MSAPTTELREAVKRAIEWHGAEAGAVVMRIVCEELVAAGFNLAAILQGTIDHGAGKLGPVVVKTIIEQVVSRMARGGR